MATLPRLVVYVQDIQYITGCSYRTASRTMRKIRALLGKQKHQYVSVSEFCQCTGLSEAEVRMYVH